MPSRQMRLVTHLKEEEEKKNANQGRSVNGGLGGRHEEKEGGRKRRELSPSATSLT